MCKGNQLAEYGDWRERVCRGRNKHGGIKETRLILSCYENKKRFTKQVGNNRSHPKRDFIQEEGGRIDGSVLSARYRPSPIPTIGLEIPLMLMFCSSRYITHQKMKDFIQDFYNYDYTAEKDDVPDNEDNDEIHIVQ